MTDGFRLASDENLDARLINGLRREIPRLDLVRVVDVGLYSCPDPEVLEWAANEGRILLTHDFRTMPTFGWERVANGLKMPGIIAINDRAPRAQVVADLSLVIASSAPMEYRDLVIFLPFP